MCDPIGDKAPLALFSRGRSLPVSASSATLELAQGLQTVTTPCTRSKARRDQKPCRPSQTTDLVCDLLLTRGEGVTRLTVMSEDANGATPPTLKADARPYNPERHLESVSTAQLGRAPRAAVCRSCGRLARTERASGQFFFKVRARARNDASDTLAALIRLLPSPFNSHHAA
jgi:hypothetical protein